MSDHEIRFLTIMLMVYVLIAGVLVHFTVKKACGQSVLAIIASYFRKKP